jgi:hypothetical protein
MTKWEYLLVRSGSAGLYVVVSPAKARALSELLAHSLMHPSNPKAQVRLSVGDEIDLGGIDWTDLLDTLGTQGWELVSTNPEQFGMRLYFKRPMP